MDILFEQVEICDSILMPIIHDDNDILECTVESINLPSLGCCVRREDGSRDIHKIERL